MPTAAQLMVDNRVESQTYIGESYGGFSVPGPHHREHGSQDAFWPADNSDAALLADLKRADVAQHGRLYMLADGVSLCADGREASRLAVATAGAYYYQTAGAYSNDDSGRMQRLEDAVWQAHLQVAAWDERFFCWRAEKHADGVSHTFKPAQLISSNPPLCPLCNNLVVGLQTTLLAALLRGNSLTVVGVGDCSAFRLPSNPTYGVEWIYTPQDGQFLGMPSLTRRAIGGQSFTLGAGDRLLLCSDGLVKVLNGLHSDMGWHQFLRSRLLGSYQSDVSEMMLDLDGWRLSKPRQRKLHDDLTLVAVEMPDEESQQQALDAAFANYDQLVAQQLSQTESLSAIWEFLDQAEATLLYNNNADLWQLYATAYHHYALLKLDEATNWGDESLHNQIVAATRVNQATRDWLGALRRLAQLETWQAQPELIGQTNADLHTQIVSDLYAVPLASTTPQLTARLTALLGDIIGELQHQGLPAATAHYRGLAEFLASSAESSPPQLPQRQQLRSATTHEENTRALEHQITQAIADGKWAIAQELITELNKIKGSEFNFDTEGVDTAPTRAAVLQQLGRRPALPTVANHLMPASEPSTAAKGGKRLTEKVVPFAQVRRIFHTREPKALLKDAAVAAFAPADERDLGLAYDLLSEAAKLYPALAVASEQWQVLWRDRNASFDIHESQTLAADQRFSFQQLADAVQIARDVALLAARAADIEPGNWQKEQARSDLRLLKRWQPLLEVDRTLPYALSLGAGWYASALCQTRLSLPANGIPAGFTALIWHAVRIQDSSSNRLREPLTALQIDALRQEEPSLYAVSQAIAAAMNSVLLIERAIALNSIELPDQLGSIAAQYVAILQRHVARAAWEYTMALAERPVEQQDAPLTAIETSLSDHAAVAVTGPDHTLLGVTRKLLLFLASHREREIANGFRAYRLVAPRELDSADYQRLEAWRSATVRSAWELTLQGAGSREPLLHAPDSAFMNRAELDQESASGRTLHAVRALLPHVVRSAPDWIDRALLLSRWQPPLSLAERDAALLQRTIDKVVDHAWQYLLAAVRGDAVPALSVARLHEIRAALDSHALDDVQENTQWRLTTLKALLPLLIRQASASSSQAELALMAQQLLPMLATTLSQADFEALKQACEQFNARLWQFSVEAVRAPQQADDERLAAELHAITSSSDVPGTLAPLWQAAGNLLQIARQRQQQRRTDWDDLSQILFRAFRTVNVAQEQDSLYQQQNQQLYEYSYFHLIDWKDSLPRHPSLLRRRRVNRQKRRIQEYWLLRKEYGH